MQRIRQRTEYDIEMLSKYFCIENYSRVIAGRAPPAPMTLLDYFPDDFLLFVDESHVTLPAVGPCTTATIRASSRGGLRLPPAVSVR